MTRQEKHESRAGRPPKGQRAVTIKLRRCLTCGRFVGWSKDHVCLLKDRSTLKDSDDQDNQG